MAGATSHCVRDTTGYWDAFPREHMSHTEGRLGRPAGSDPGRRSRAQADRYWMGRSRVNCVGRTSAPRDCVSEAFDLREACRQYTGSPVVATSHLEHRQANESHRVELADGHSIVVRILKLTTPERTRQEVSIQHALVSAGMTTPVSQTMKKRRHRK